MALPPLNSYQDPEVLTPPDEPDDDSCTCDPAPAEIGGAQHRAGCGEDPDDGTCDWCGEWYCGPDCKPPFVSPYLAARSRERRENRDPES